MGQKLITSGTDLERVSVDTTARTMADGEDLRKFVFTSPDGSRAPVDVELIRDIILRTRDTMRSISLSTQSK